MSESIVPLKISSVDKLIEQWIAEGERRATSHTADLATRARYRQEGAEHERERIIELLKAEYDRVFDWKDYPASNVCLNLIGSIKGEK